MEKRLLGYIHYIEEQLKIISDEKERDISKIDIKALKEDMLIQIGFFAHERIVHLIVTVTFALLTIIAVVGYLICEKVGVIALIIMLLVLLIPYIRHYYILENGVQKLYRLYDEVSHQL